MVRTAKRAKRRQDIERAFLTTKEAQGFLGVCNLTLYKLIDQGLPSHRVGRRRVFLKDELIRWIKEH